MSHCASDEVFPLKVTVSVCWPGVRSLEVKSLLFGQAYPDLPQMTTKKVMNHGAHREDHCLELLELRWHLDYQ
jgi:hypothetical protein